jgi:ribosomal protein S12 methylthiotransferase accessory factor
VGLARAIGVTRVARVTGLDRSGVEVACAVRPGGHVLQVTNGKGLTFAEAARGAVCEAAELWCAERVAAGDLAWAEEPSSGERFARRAAADLLCGARASVPAAAVHAPPQGGPLLGLSRCRWTSNGMGAAPRWERALLHALLEAVERDGLARALPEGWTEREVRRRLLEPAVLGRSGAEAARLVARLGARGLAAHLFDLAPGRGGTGLPLAGALLFDAPESAVPLAAGYACRLDPGAAALAALLEAAQSRLTDIHGAREDVARMEEEDVERLRRACAARGGGSAADLRDPGPHLALASALDLDPVPSPDPVSDPDPDLDLVHDVDHGLRPRAPHSSSPGPRRGRVAERAPAGPRTRAARTDGARASADRAAVAHVLARLRRAGHAHLHALDLAPPSLPVRVAKVLSPSLRLSPLL